MHIPDNYLSPQTCAVMGAVMVPAWAIAVKKVKEEVSEKKMPVLGISAAFTFLIMMFNVPVPGGTTAHAICATLVAILFGPFTAMIAVSTALLIQALMFGDGGILAFGANCFNMALVMPLTGWLIFNGLKRIWKNENFLPVLAFFSAYVSILLAALCNSIELGLQPLLFSDSKGFPMYCPYGWNITIPAMLISHLVAGILDGAITAGAYIFIKRTYPDLIMGEAGSQLAGSGKKRPLLIYIILTAIAVITPLGLIASGDAFGEWDPDKLPGMSGVIPQGMAHGFNYKAPLDNYGSAINLFNSKGAAFDLHQVFGYIISAILGSAILLITCKLITELMRKRGLKTETK
jgi:cobalt/nickel transport system permease protein